MFKRILMWATALLLLSNYASAQNFFISGGHTYGAAICGNGTVFTWGDNSRQQLGRSLGGGLTMDNEPGIVSFGTGIRIQAIDAGSGSHAVALGCDSTVWTWGAGDQGQLGNGANSGQPGSADKTLDEASPVQVLAGETNPSDPTAPLYDVVYVTSGTSQSYAVTKDKKLLAWGSNELGQLGSGDIGYNTAGATPVKITDAKESSLPVYVRDVNGKILENVIAVDAGDTHCYALVDDDGDGDPETGRVYAWGGHGYNDVISGIDGTGGNPDYAHQAVLVAGNQDLDPLTGIFQITAGDAAGFFIQKSTGFVFSIGSDDGGIRGISDQWDQNLYAGKVSSGEMKAYTGFDDLSNVKSIAAGQANGLAAVEIDGEGYVMVWGRKGPYDLGDDKKCGGDPAFLGLGPTPVFGTTQDVPTPRFIKHADGSLMKNVISVSDGDGVSYAMTEDPVTLERTIWTWGCNAYGQLGLGDFDNRYYPTKLTLPSCDVAIPCPVAKLGPDTIKVCPNGDMPELYAGSKGDSYSYSWYFIMGTRSRKLIGPSSSVTAAYYTPTRTGLYAVQIDDNRPPSEQTCSPCATAYDTIYVGEMDAPFDTIINSFCGSKGTFKVALHAADMDYEFFNSPSGGISLGAKGDPNVVQASGDKIVSITVDNLATTAVDSLLTDSLANPTLYPAGTVVRDSVYSIWIEDKTIAKGTVGESLPSSFKSTSGGIGNMESMAQNLVVYKDIYLESTVVSLVIDQVGASIEVIPVIYGQMTNSNGAPLADLTNVLWSGLPQTSPVYNTLGKEDFVIKFEDGAAGVPKLLLGDASRGKSYWIGMQIVSRPKLNNAYIYATGTGNNPFISIPIIESSLGSGIVDIVASSSGTSNQSNNTYNQPQNVDSYLHTYTFSKPTDYTCGRKEIIIRKGECGCNEIDEATFSVLMDGIVVPADTLCPNDVAGVDISFKATSKNGEPELISYQWYAWNGVSVNDTIPVMDILGNPKGGDLKTGTTASKTLSSITTSGYHIIKLWDNNDWKNDACVYYDTAYVHIAELPTYDFGVGQTICKGDAFSAVKLDLTGVGPWKLTYGDATTETVGTAGDETYAHTLTPTKAITYSLTAITDASGCAGDIVAAETAKVVVNDLPEITFDDPADICSFRYPSEVTAVDVSSSVTTAETVTYSDANGHISATGSFTPPIVTSTTSYELFANVEDANGCKNADTAKIKVYALPAVSFSLEDKYCSGEVIDYFNEAKADGTSISATDANATVTTTPVLALSGGTVDASALTSGTDYVFTMEYSKAVTTTLTCSDTAQQTTKSILVPAIPSTTDKSISGIQTATVTLEISASATDATYELHWLSPGWNVSGATPVELVDSLGKTSLKPTHPVGETFEYGVYQTINGCSSDTSTVSFSSTACSATSPTVTSADFCAVDVDATKLKTITSLASGTGFTTAWLPEDLYGTGFDGRKPTDAGFIVSDSHTLTETTPGDYIFYVAAYDPSPADCWSSPVKVTFTLKKPPVAEINIDADDIITCFSDDRMIDIPLTPAYNTSGVVDNVNVYNTIFTIGGTASAPKFNPHDHTTGATLELEYKVTELHPSGLVCSSLASDTETLTVQYLAPPTIAPVTTGVKPVFNPLVAAGVAPLGEGFNWYDSVGTSVLPNSASYDIAQDLLVGTEYNGNINLKACATQFTTVGGGCESESACGVVSVVDCPFPAPEIKAITTANICETGAATDLPIIELTAASKLNYNATGKAEYHWSYVVPAAEDIPGTASNSITPSKLTAGTYTVQVYVVDENTALTPGEMCASNPTTIEYTIHPQPKPSISGLVDEICLTGGAKETLTALNNGVAKGANDVVKYFVDGVEKTSTNGVYSFDPALFTKGTKQLHIEYTTEFGCMETTTLGDYDITIHEVPNYDPSFDNHSMPSLAQFIAGGYTHTFTGTPNQTLADGTPFSESLTLQWYAVDPKDHGTIAATGLTYPYKALQPYPTDDLAVTGEYHDVKFYVVQKMSDPLGAGCVSEPISVETVSTDCPTPKPISDDVIACDYWENEIPKFEVKEGVWSNPSDAVPVILKYRTSGSEWAEVPSDGQIQPYTDISNINNTYEVEFAAQSTSLAHEECISASITKKITVKKAAIPEIKTGKQSKDVCFGVDEEFTFEVNPVSSQTANWYASEDVSIPPLVNSNATKTKFTASSANGDQTYYVTFQMDVAPQCESEPVGPFTMSIMPEILAPTTIPSLDVCSGVSDKLLPKTLYNVFPSDAVYFTPQATQNGNATGNELRWYLSDEENQNTHEYEGESYTFSESKYVNSPGSSMLFYVRTERLGTQCHSPFTSVEVRSVVSPDAPKFVSITNSGSAVCANDLSELKTTKFGVVHEENYDYEWYTMKESDYDIFKSVSAILADSLVVTTASDNDSLDVQDYLQNYVPGNDPEFILRAMNGTCPSPPTPVILSVSTPPNATIKGDSVLRFCQQYDEYQTIEVEEYVDDYAYLWAYSDEDGDGKEFDIPDKNKPNIATWKNSNVGVDVLRLRVKKPESEGGCVSESSITLIVADKTTPYFTYDYFYGNQEIVFRNQPTVDSIFEYITDKKLGLDSVRFGEQYWTNYKWNIIYAEDGSQSLRTYDQFPQTTYDSLFNNQYYTNRGPQAFYNTPYELLLTEDSLLSQMSIDPATEYLFLDTAGELRTKVWRLEGERVKSVDGKDVFTYGGVPFEYGLSLVSLKRTIQGYDSPSCTMTSPEEEVFMKIVTGLYLPTSLVPGHSSPLISVFKPFGYKLKDFKIYVYDNWGNTVWYSDKLDELGSPVEAWDGRDKEGNMLPADCYIWKVDATFEDGSKWEGNKTTGRKKSTTGSVCLIR